MKELFHLIRYYAVDNMAKFISISLLLICAFSTPALAQPSWQWQQTISSRGTLNGYDMLEAICETKDSGYIGVGTSYGADDGYYIFRLDKNGKLLSQEYNKQRYAGGLVRVLTETKDGNVLLAGSFNTQATGTFQGYWGRAAKVDKKGVLLWEKYYKSGDVINPDIGKVGSGHVNVSKVLATGDGGYLLGATVNGTAGGDKKENTRDAFISYSDASSPGDYWIIKTDDKGQVQWEKTLGSKVVDEFKSAAETKDGGYIIGGSTLYYSSYFTTPTAASGDRTSALRDSSHDLGDFWIVKLDQSGKIVWEKTLGGKGAEKLAFIIPTKDEGYFVGGTSTSPISGDKTEGFRGGEGSYAEAIGVKSGDYWVLKLDKTGAIVWQKTIGGASGEVLVSGYEDKDGGFVIGGTSASEISGDKTAASNAVGPGEEDDFWVVKLSATGNIVWQKVLGGNTVDVLQTMLPTQNGAFILGGYSYSPVSATKSAPLLVPLYEGYDIWLTKFGPNQVTATICPEATYPFDGKNISKPGVYTSTTYTHKFDGSDSLVELTLNHYETTPPAVVSQQDLISSPQSYSNYQWLLNGVVIPGANGSSIIPKQDGLYRLVVTGPNGCADTSLAYRPVFKTNLFVPNMFSPNGDGKNDVFKVFGNNLAYAHIQVYNQWGQKLFESNDGLNTGWDGKVNGKTQPVGVYMYILQAGENNGNVIKQKGSIAIVQ
jgi:gliding motility-associated-like protein